MNHSLRTNPWFVCLLPFVVFMLVGSLEPVPAVPAAEGAVATAAKPWLDLGIEYRHYPLVYAAKIALTVVAIIFVWSGYRQYTRRLSFIGLAVGVLGAAVWIALATWQRQWMPLLADKTGVEWFKTLGERSAFNPLEQLRDQPAAGLRLFSHTILRSGGCGADHRGIFPPRFFDALCDDSELVGSSLWQCLSPRRYRGYGGPDVNAPTGSPRCTRLVLRCHLAHDPHPQHLGLHPGPCRYELTAGHLCCIHRQLVADVKLQGAGQRKVR